MAHMQNMVTAAVPLCLEQSKIKVDFGDFCCLHSACPPCVYIILGGVILVHSSILAACSFSSVASGGGPLERRTRLAHMQNVVTAAAPLCLERSKIKVNSGDFSLAGRERDREDHTTTDPHM